MIVGDVRKRFSYLKQFCFFFVYNRQDWIEYFSVFLVKILYDERLGCRYICLWEDGNIQVIYQGNLYFKLYIKF